MMVKAKDGTISNTQDSMEFFLMIITHARNIPKEIQQISLFESLHQVK